MLKYIPIFLFGAIVGVVLTKLSANSDTESLQDNTQAFHQKQVEREFKASNEKGSSSSELPVRNGLPSKEGQVKNTAITNQMAMHFIDRMGEKELETFLINFVNIRPEDMPQVDIRRLAKELLRVAFDEKTSEQTTREKIVFSSSVRSGNDPVEETGIFHTHDLRIYACFSNQGKISRHQKVLVKWRRKEDYDLLVMKYYSINQNSSWNYIWYRKESGWEIGSYEVKIYSLGDSVNCLAEGSYSVEGLSTTRSYSNHTSSVEFGDVMKGDSVLNYKSNFRKEDSCFAFFRYHFTSEKAVWYEHYINARFISRDLISLSLNENKCFIRFDKERLLPGQHMIQLFVNGKLNEIGIFTIN